MIQLLLAAVMALFMAAGPVGQISGAANMDHVHGYDCGHYWDGYQWLTIYHHVHQSGCGHYYYHGQWHAKPELYI